MIAGKRIVVVLPAYNAESTLRRTVAEIAPEVVDHVLLVDDASSDRTVTVAQSLGLQTIQHSQNRGYGGNQKTCYAAALAAGADVVVMLHPDYQYDPRLVPALAELVARGGFDLALGSRILGRGALAGGMPLYKYLSNRALTAFENLAVDQKLSEYHTGFRAFSRPVLEALPLARFAEDWSFDAEVLAWAAWKGWKIGEISCPARYEADSSSIGAWDALGYGLRVVSLSLRCRLAMMGVRTGVFAEESRRGSGP